MNSEFDGQDPLDESLEILANLRHETSPDFVDSLRAKIQRRVAASQVVFFTCLVPAEVAPALGQIFLYLCKSTLSEKEYKT
jgi:hypothetical protein